MRNNVELSMTCPLDTLSCGLKHFSLFYSVAVYTETRIKPMLRTPLSNGYN